MFGFIHDSIRELFVRQYGEELWLQVLSRAGFENGKENMVMTYYSDEETFKLVDSVAAISKRAIDAVWEEYGSFLVTYTMERGWDELLKVMSYDLKGFLDNLDALHYFIDHVVFKANLRGPSFRCTQESETELTLHYYSVRKNLYPIVQGVIREVGRRVFNQHVKISFAGRNQRMVTMATGEKLEEHVIFKISIEGPIEEEDGTGSDVTQTASVGHFHKELISADEMDNKFFQAENLVRNVDIVRILPYHIVFDKDCVVQQVGSSLYKLFMGHLTIGQTHIYTLLELQRPQVPFDCENILNFINAVFVVRVRQLAPSQTSARSRMSLVSDAASINDGWSMAVSECMKLKGQMILLDNGFLCYMASPYVTSIAELIKGNLRLADMPLHDVTRDMILLNQQRLTDVEQSRQLETTQIELAGFAKMIEEESAMGEMLLSQVLPAVVAKQLMEGKTVEACSFDNATIMFSDIPAFPELLAKCNPKEIVYLLNELFIRFDRLVEINQVYKVETIKDSYMVVGGVPIASGNHAELVCQLALGMLWEARSVRGGEGGGDQLLVRIGIHSGHVVAGVVGNRMPRFCLFGDTVNTASRMGSHGSPNKIHCSEAVFKAAQQTGRFKFQERGWTTIKGKGLMFTYWLLASNKKSLWEIIDRQRGEENTIDGYSEVHDAAIAEGQTTNSQDPKTNITIVSKDAGPKKVPVTVFCNLI